LFDRDSFRAQRQRGEITDSTGKPHGQIMKVGWQASKWLKKKAKGGFRGYPVATVAFYGPDDRRASKMAVGIITEPSGEPFELRRWHCETGDIRANDAICEEVARFLRDHRVHSVSLVDGIIGCPHEEGIDYPEGEACPQCPFWAGRDRWDSAKRM
jgi:hypothetical protein